MTSPEHPAATRASTLQTAQVNGVRIAYESTGSATVPLVLVHGAWGSRRNWDAVVPGLARHQVAA
jgi:pimeloyl-ACP methyl ester carboxylesterase